LKFNLSHNILFFRISSDLIPFASHPICKFNWQEVFKGKFRQIGTFVKSCGMRVSMHPDQFTLINSPHLGILRRSVKELKYHCQVLDLMGLGPSAKIQIHVGGVYGDKEKSMLRFIHRFNRLDQSIRRRLVIENDDKSYTLRDCLNVHAKTKIPVLFDSFHHEINSSGETLKQAFELFTSTWKKSDGLPLMDYSSQQSSKRTGKHAESIDVRQFELFLSQSNPFDFDMMLEIKDKEESAIQAVEIASGDGRFAKTGTRAHYD